MLLAIGHITFFVGLKFPKSFVVNFQTKGMSCYIIHYGPRTEFFF